MYSGATNNNNKMLASRLNLIRAQISKLLPSLKLNKVRTPTLTKLALLATSLMILPKYIKLAEQQQQQQQHTQQQTQQTQPQQQQQTQQQAQPTTTNTSGLDQSQYGGVINYIRQYDDARKLDLKGVTLLWYECCGNQVIDNEVINMLRKFVQTNYQSISCPFKVIIDRTPRSRTADTTPYYKKQLQLILIKPQNLKPIRLSKHLSFSPSSCSLSYSSLFSRLTQQLNQFQQINFTNIHQLISGIGNRPYESLIVMNAPKQSIKIGKAKKKFGNFVEGKSGFGVFVQKGIVTDQMTGRYLGLPGFKAGEDNVYVIVPDSQNICIPGKQVTINGHKYHIYAPWQVNQCLKIPPYLQKSSANSLSLKISVDLNQNIYSQLSCLYQQLSPNKSYPLLAQIPKFLYFNTSKQKPVQIMLQKNNFDTIVNAYSTQSRHSEQEKKELLYGGSKWKYDGEDCDAGQLEKWIRDVVDGKVQASYDSQKKEDTKVKRYNSTRITGQQYQKILHQNPSLPKLIFHYSQHCFSCNKFKHIFEQIAEQKKNQINFYRIDNDYNRAKGLVNYASTPVFVLYKKNAENGKLEHFIYKNTIFTKGLFQAFLDITRGIKVVDGGVLERVVGDRRNTGDVTIEEFK